MSSVRHGNKSNEATHVEESDIYVLIPFMDLVIVSLDHNLFHVALIHFIPFIISYCLCSELHLLQGNLGHCVVTDFFSFILHI